MNAAPDTVETADSDPTYAFKPSLMGSWCEYSLKANGLHWQIGPRSGLVPYERISAMRLSYKPVTMQSRRFVTEIWSDSLPKIQIVSVSWRSVVEQERLDGAYSAFVSELHKRLKPSGREVQFTAGLPVVSYWIGITIFAVVLVTMAVLLVRALRLGEWGASVIIGGIFAAFALQIGNFFRRNFPLRYSADAIPPGVLPRG
jgi:hypothetical protein